MGKVLALMGPFFWSVTDQKIPKAIRTTGTPPVFRYSD